MYVEGGLEKERPRGITDKEKSDALRADAKMLGDQYSENVKSLIDGTSQQLGEKDAEGFRFHAKEMQRILTTLQDPSINAEKWPEHFSASRKDTGSLYRWNKKTSRERGQRTSVP
jgi:hypothetical protein